MDESVKINREILENLISDRTLESRFQPIVDLYSLEIIAHEILTGCPESFETTADMFHQARNLGLCWELEYACRHRALERIVEIGEGKGSCDFFMNVSPHIFNDQRFGHGKTLEQLRDFGIDQQRIVLEITEVSQVTDYEFFESMVRHYRDEGFRIALDDFGAGHSSLLTLVASAPNYIKLDRALVSQIEQYSYKQHLVKSVLAFAANVDSHVIAEGVETLDEIKTLIRLGIRYAQGFLLAKPSPEPVKLDEGVKEDLREITSRNNHIYLSGFDDSLQGLVLRPPTIQKGTTTCEELVQIFQDHPGADHVVILDDAKRPYATLGRQRFYASTGGPFGYSLLQRKPAETIAHTSPLIVNERTEITTLGRLAMGRQNEDTYDPVTIVNQAGEFLGTVTMKQLLIKFIDLEIQQATECNPLTNLPGNRSIQQWISEAVQNPPFSIIYADLDRFKEYNDTYGFSQGDRMIRLCGDVMCETLAALSSTLRVGHIGGDDFTAVVPSVVSEALLSEICERFDKRKQQLFTDEHRRQGFYLAHDRSGQERQIPLVTLSLAIVTSDNIHAIRHREEISQITAELKNEIKNINAKKSTSGYLIDRRQYNENP